MQTIAYWDHPGKKSFENQEQIVRKLERMNGLKKIYPNPGPLLPPRGYLILGLIRSV